MNQNKRFRSILLILTAGFQLLLAGNLFAQTSSNISYLGNFGKGDGQCISVFSLGSLVYYGVGERLKIADFSTPANPVQLGAISLEGNIGYIVRSGSYVYAVAGTKAYVINVSNPLSPAISGSVSFPGASKGVATKSTYVFVAAGDGGLRIINAASPTSPVEIAKIDTIGYAESVAISGDYAYVCTGSKLRIINVANPSVPVYAGELGSPLDYYQYATVRGNYAYVCDYSNALRIVNVANPAAPQVVSDFMSGTRTTKVQLDGNYAYIANGDSLKIVDVTDAAHPFWKGSLPMNDRGVCVSVGINHVFVADRNSGLKCVNVTNPAAPVLASAVPIQAPATGSAYGAFVSGSYAYVAYGSSGLRIIDISNPTSPVKAGEVALPGDARGVVVKGNYAYVAVRSKGVRVVNVANPAAPVYVDSINVLAGRGIVLNGNYLYVAAGDSGLTTVNITDPAHPVVVGNISGLYGDGLTTAGNVLALSDYSKINLIDLTNPAAPAVKGQVTGFVNGSSGMAVSNGYMYVPDFDTLRIYNISNLTAPAFAYKVFCGASWDGSVVIDGKYAYIAAEEKGVRVFDITNPLAAVEKAFFVNTASVRGLAVSYKTVYAAQLGTGLTILKNDLITSMNDKSVNAASFNLAQNYPNPFNPSTVIEFSLKQAGNVNLTVYNTIGQKVAALVNGFVKAGSHKIDFNAANLPAGVYMYRLEGSEISAARKMILIK